MQALKFRIPRTLGFGAGLLALSLIVYSVAGALWGIARPTLTGRRVDDGGYAIEDVDNIQFQSFITFALITGALGVVIGVLTYLRNPARRGIWALLWVGVVCFTGAVAFYVVGGVTATSAPDNPGDVVQFVPKFSPRVAWLVSPFMAIFAYWSAVFVDGDFSEVGDRGASPSTALMSPISVAKG